MSIYGILVSLAALFKEGLKFAQALFKESEQKPQNPKTPIVSVRNWMKNVRGWVWGEDCGYFGKESVGFVFSFLAEKLGSGAQALVCVILTHGCGVESATLLDVR